MQQIVIQYHFPISCQIQYKNKIDQIQHLYLIHQQWCFQNNYNVPNVQHSRPTLQEVLHNIYNIVRDRETANFIVIYVRK